MVTTLKDTSKPVADVPFPSLTICGSGFHINNVEKKLVLDFKEWRAQNGRNETTKQAIKKDTEDFMQTKFQIKPSQTEQEHPLNILDILDTMIAPDVDVSLHANSIRENVIACEESTQSEEDNSDCTYSCSDNRFMLSGKKCFHGSTEKNNQSSAVNACQDMAAELATISSAAEDKMVYRMMTENGATGSVYIGLTNNNGKITWQDGSTLQSYTNWGNFPWPYPDGEPHQEPDWRHGDCVFKMTKYDQKGKWGDRDCTTPRKYACSMAAYESCDTKRILSNTLQERFCVQTNNSSTQGQASHLPGIDIFLNPARKHEKEKIIKTKKDFAKNYF